MGVKRFSLKFFLPPFLSIIQNIPYFNPILRRHHTVVVQENKQSSKQNEKLVRFSSFLLCGVQIFFGVECLTLWSMNVVCNGWGYLKRYRLTLWMLFFFFFKCRNMDHLWARYRAIVSSCHLCLGRWVPAGRARPPRAPSARGGAPPPVGLLRAVRRPSCREGAGESSRAVRHRGVRRRRVWAGRGPRPRHRRPWSWGWTWVPSRAGTPCQGRTAEGRIPRHRRKRKDGC